MASPKAVQSKKKSPVAKPMDKKSMKSTKGGLRKSAGGTTTGGIY